ncbi:MAG TPA: GLPGLI family protein [Saprospiraceae bacterium]|nr:GLPGLI family protein [Saprospiraceae bacterium]
MKFTPLFFLLFFSLTGFAQQNQGTIVYEQTIDVHRQLTGERERFKQWAPKTITNKYQLKFTEEESMFSTYYNEEEDPGPGRGRRWGSFFGGSAGDMYRNFEQMRFVNSREFEGKRYLIKGDIEQTPWKVTGVTRDIGGYPCMQAIYDDTLEQRALTAWFTPSIPVSAGPGIYGQLPGLIMALDINNGETVFRPVTISFEVPEEKDLEEPKRGKDITNEEFEKMQRERIEEMREQRSQQGGGRPGGGD